MISTHLLMYGICTMEAQKDVTQEGSLLALGMV